VDGGGSGAGGELSCINVAIGNYKLVSYATILFYNADWCGKANISPKAEKCPI
jgi:hypothetical protein